MSHEWVSTDHPDPDGEQLKVLKAALMRMLSEPDSIPVSIQAEFMYGLQHGLLMTEMRARPLFVWYDFFSCPQRMHGPIGSRFTHPSEQELAIHSIPAYVEMCRCVVILCPPILHKQTQDGVMEFSKKRVKDPDCKDPYTPIPKPQTPDPKRSDTHRSCSTKAAGQREDGVD